MITEHSRAEEIPLIHFAFCIFNFLFSIVHSHERLQPRVRLHSSNSFLSSRDNRVGIFTLTVT
jgi:hypothetical protein